jgi:hypothetical protein
MRADVHRRGAEALEVNSQIRELVIAYVATAAPFVIALLLRRAPGRAYLRWPVYSVMVMVLGVVLWNLIHRRLPPSWSLTHASALYYGALGLYVLLGFCAGLLLAMGAGSGNRDNSE